MLYFKLACALILLACVGGFIWQAVTDWRATSPDKRDEIGEVIALGSGSLVKFWMRLVGVIGGLIGSLTWLADALQLPQVTEAINKYIQPQYVTVAILAIALIGVWTRNRTSSEKTVF